MGVKFFHPLGKENHDKEGNSYNSGGKPHGVGKLDYSGDNMPLYAMCDGTIAYCGTYNDGTSCCALECTENGLGITFYIRYIHGIYDVSQGQTVKKGDLLGHSSNVGSNGAHLHIDFSLIPNGFQPVQGNLDGTNFIYNSQSYPLISEVDLDKVNKWYEQNGAGDGKIGYCWLVMASKLEEVSGSLEVGTGYDERVDMTKKRTFTDSDWNAIYGIWAYEQNGIFEDDEYEVAAGITEWIIRVFRNRLVSGTSIDDICKWDPKNNSNRAMMEPLSKLVDQNTKDFIKKIISGYNFGYVEKLAQKYPYPEGQDINDPTWKAKLYAACTFSGGKKPRQPELTLAVVPFNHGGKFMMEAQLTTAVRKLWNEGFFNPNPVLG